MSNQPKRRWFGNSQLICENLPIGPSARLHAHRLTDEALLVSENHKRLKGTDWGGPFFTRRVIDDFTPDPTPRRFLGYQSDWTNVRFVPSSVTKFAVPGLIELPSWATEQSEVAPHFAKGWKRARPGNPAVEAGQWLAELRDLPSIPLRAIARLGWFRGLGSEYLNVHFGWKPFVKDLIGMYETYRDLNKLLSQLVKDNGRGVRRRRKLGDTTDTSSVVTNSSTLAAFMPAISNGALMANSVLTVETTTRERIWFAGRFRYYVPDIGSDQWTRRASLALFGLNPTPSLLWEVLPWSWLVDWFSNVGDVVSNLSTNAVDNLVADYAYIMREKTVSQVASAHGSWVGYGAPGDPSYYWPSGTASAMSVHSVTTKSRDRGTPYGLGLTWDGLSPYQQSILAALGMSRSRFS